MPPPKFAERIARLPEVLAFVAEYPDGLSLSEIAERFGTTPEAVSEDLTCFHDLESWGWTFDIFRRSVIEFTQPDDASGDAAGDVSGDGPGASTVVRVVGNGSVGLGVEHLTPGELAVIYTAGVALLETDHEDADLDEALSVIAETMYGAPASEPHVGDPNAFLAQFRTAVEEHRRVRLVYSRAWRQGVVERDVEPLRLVQTRRGWEVDAGPVGPEGNLRTYLLSHVRSAELLEETFEPPSQLDARLARQRTTTSVRMVLAQDARWAADMYAEDVAVVREDEEVFEADLELLPPAGERVGLVMLASGPSTRIIEPTSVVPEANALVHELISHHSAPLLPD